MKKFTKNKDINRIVRQVIKFGWRIRYGKKHASLIAPNGLQLTIPSTPSDHRALHNFSSDLRKLHRQQGLRYA
ncbi:hypothetical protein ACNPKZ_14240 [Shewanella algae]|uniref:hypothetical protein n=1 Tax=Shewanella algae TaxID=38313 RepID=UPI003AAACA6A